MKKILFRADGSSTTGLGHLYRIFALIEIFSSEFDCLLLTRESSTTAVIPNGYAFKTIPDAVTTGQEPGWIHENFGTGIAWIIADGYHFISSYQKEIKRLGYKLAYVDDLCTEEMYADLVINHAMSVTPSNYKAQPYTGFALGTPYAILRPLFIAAAASERSIAKTECAFVCFGGADTLDLTLKATQALLRFKAIKKIHVVIGAAYTHTGIFELEKKYPQLSVNKNLSEAGLIEVMKSSDFAIAPASNILYELCSVKMPVLSGYYVENQKNIYSGALQKHIIVDGGNFENYTVNDFEEKIAALISRNDLQTFIDAQSMLFDGNIKARFLNLIMDITYRKAVAKDVLLVFNWANDKLSRANSYFSEPIALETHSAWFEKKLQDPNAAIYIAEVNGEPAGMVRYETAGENAVVGILVGDAFRGKGLAASLLKATAQLYFKDHTQPVLAYIKQENTASVRSFEKSGYKKLKEEIVHGCSSYVYKLEDHDVQ